MRYTVKQKLGAAAIDVPLYAWHLSGLDAPGLPEAHWTRIRNRRDELEIGPDGRGVRRVGRWTSRLHGASVFPALGERLMRAAFREWPIATGPALPGDVEEPEVTFVVGHRGKERLPLLLRVLETIAGQSGVAVECVVVEQSTRPEIGADLPEGVRLVRNPPPDPGMPYSRSWAFNVGARRALGRLLVFHDNDLLVPSRYAAELAAVHREGWEVIDLKRFIFYLSREDTDRLADDRRVPEGARVESVLQNARGGSVAVDREAFLALGGFDEAFVGWGGEDNEFWERARPIRRVWPWGHLPLVHLWHGAQPRKGSRDRDTARLLDARSRLPAEARVAELVAREFGCPERPDPEWA